MRFNFVQIWIRYRNRFQGDYDDCFSRVSCLHAGWGLLLADGGETVNPIGHVWLYGYSIYRRGESGHVLVEGVIWGLTGNNVTKNQV